MNPEPHPVSSPSKDRSMTATPTPLRELHRRFLSDTSQLPDEWSDWRAEFANDLLAIIRLSARDEAGAVLGNTDPPPGWEPEPSPAEIEEGRALSATLAALATPPASGEADPQNWPQWVKDAVRNANEAGRHAGRAEATPPAASGDGRSPSYDALLIIVQSVCGALKRAGFDDCDDPGEAIDVMREGYERRLAAVAPAGMEPTDEMVERVRHAVGCYDGVDIDRTQVRSVLRQAARLTAPTPPATAGEE